MITRKLMYSKWNTVRGEITGLMSQEEGKESKIILIGLKNEDISQGVVIRLNKIVKKIEEEFKALQEQFNSIDKEDVDRENKIKALWEETCEISFEEIDIDKLDFKRKESSFGERYDYTPLIEIITNN